MSVGSVSDGEVAAFLGLAVVNGHRTKGRGGSRC
jgi:hypothetical protein